MSGYELAERFHDRIPGPDLPFVMNDEVEVLEGVYVGRRGVVELVAWAEAPMQFLVDFRDGTDEMFPAGALKLLRRDV
jgi:hypothetical protein